VVPAEVGLVAHRLERVLGEDEQPAGQPLEAAEDLQHILAVVGHRHRLAVRPDVLELLDDLPRLRIDHHHRAVGRLGVQDRDKHLALVYREAQVERRGVLTDPLLILDVGDLLPLARVRVGRVEDGHVVLPEVVHHREDLAVRREARFVGGALDVFELDLPHIGAGGDLLQRQVAGRAFRRVQAGHRLPTLAVHDQGGRGHAQDQSRIAVARVVDNGVQAGQRLRRGTRDLAALHQQLGHRYHFPVNLVAFDSLVFVLAGLLGLRQPRQAQGAAVDPAALKRRLVLGHPVAAERHQHLGLLVPPRAVEERADVLLAVRAGEAVGVRVDGGVNAQADAGAVRDVFQQLHLLAVIADAVDVVALAGPLQQPHLLDAGRNTVDQHILAALSGVDELEPLVRVVRRVRG